MSGGEAASSGAGMVDATARRTWDKNYYAKRARERLEEEERQLGQSLDFELYSRILKRLTWNREWTAGSTVPVLCWLRAHCHSAVLLSKWDQRW